MIEPGMFQAEALVRALLDDRGGNVDKWRKHATIETGYMPPHPSKDTKPACVVRFGESFLRGSRLSGAFWDMYGDDFRTPERALSALLVAPPPPHVFDKAQWKRWYDAEEAAGWIR